MSLEDAENMADLLGKHYANKERIKTLEERVLLAETNIIRIAESVNAIILHLQAAPEPVNPDTALPENTDPTDNGGYI